MVSRYNANGSWDNLSFDGADSGAAFAVPLDLAVDSTGDIIVVDSTGPLTDLVAHLATSRVERFSSGGVSEGPAASVPYPGAVTVDPDGDQVIVVGDIDSATRNVPLSINIFAADGAPVSSGTLTGPLYGIASGLVAVGGGSDRLYAITAYDPFSTDGHDLGAVGGQILEDVTPPTPTLGTATNVTDATATLSGTVNPEGAATTYRFEYTTEALDFWTTYLPVDPDGDGDESAGSGNADVPVSVELTGLHDSGFVLFRLVATNPAATVTTPDDSFFTLDAEPAIVTVGPATDITTHGATLQGTVDARGVVTTYHFDYSLDDGDTWTTTPVPDAAAGSGSGPVDVEAPVTGIDPNTPVRYRLVGHNSTGNTVSSVDDPDDETFTTLQDAPGAVTGAATDRTTSSATLRGTVNPFGLQATYYFEYGPSADYGSRAPLAHDSVAGNGRQPRQVAQGISGLQPGTTYHYRLVAVSTAGKAHGLDRSFTTPGQAPPRRVYEMVSPVDKGGKNIYEAQMFHASADGDWLAYGATTALDGSESAPQYPRYLARRTASGWPSVALDPPQPPNYLVFPLNAATLGVSDDGTKAVVASLKKLADGAVEGDSNVYLRDTRSGAYTTMFTTPGPEYANVAGGFSDTGGAFVAGTPDFSHVVIYGQTSSLLPGAPPRALYEWTDGQLRLASVASDGTPINKPMSGGGALILQREQHRISDDGSRIFVVPQSGPVWVRINGTTTVPVSASQRTSDLGTLRDAAFAGATSDGRTAFIFGVNLTDDSPPGIHSLYRFDVDTGELKLLTPVEASGPGQSTYGLLQTSSGGESVFFTSTAKLAPGGTAAATNIYVWHDGQVAHVGNVPVGVSSFMWMSSPHGKFFTFISSGVALRYDVDAGVATCASCRSDGRPSTGPARIMFASELVTHGGHHFPQAVTDDGVVFFDTPDPLTANDSNSSRDVYSFDGEQPTLISAGRGSRDSVFADASADGRDVFFTTADRLVGQDTDSAVDVYDARVGGGLASQNPDPPRAACAGEECGDVGSAPSVPPAASIEFLGSGNGPPPDRAGKALAKVKVSATKRTVQGTAFTISVRVPAKGRITASGANLRKATKTATKAATYKVKVSLSASGQRKLRAARTMSLKVRVGYTPPSGTASVATVTIKLKAPTARASSRAHRAVHSNTPKTSAR
ncbi:MAG TPA: hypothetical protein VK501_13975 [Baekduia sp.]|nr:hypothetical protein [Baekduia sp.]